jgi:DNA-directed RNA polymerase specialized sigma24 family protein
MIEMVVNHTSKDHDERHEIQQTLILKLYNKEKEVKRLYEEGNLKRWLYKVVWNIKIDLYRENKSISLDDDIPILIIEEHEPRDIDRVKTLPEMLEQLPEIERLWMNIYIENGQSYRAVKRSTNICRAKVKERIETILKEWKQLDIYLPQ